MRHSLQLEREFRIRARQIALQRDFFRSLLGLYKALRERGPMTIRRAAETPFNMILEAPP